VLHGAGHAIGTEIHEPPYLVPASDKALREGMIFTIEPGIYHSDHGGIRLEDDVLVGADGPVLLSSLPLELRVLG
jgi:Xaa-Pro dipeptidase